METQHNAAELLSLLQVLKALDDECVNTKTLRKAINVYVEKLAAQI